MYAHVGPPLPVDQPLQQMAKRPPGDCFDEENPGHDEAAQGDGPVEAHKADEGHKARAENPNGHEHDALLKRRPRHRLPIYAASSPAR